MLAAGPKQTQSKLKIMKRDFQELFCSKKNAIKEFQAMCYFICTIYNFFLIMYNLAG